MSRLPVALQCAVLALVVAPIVTACGGQAAAPAPTQAAQSKAVEAAKPAGDAKPAGSPSASPAAAAGAPAGAPGGIFTIAELGPLPPSLHPYPDSGSYSSSWSDTWGMMGCALITLDANTLEYQPYLASEWNVSSDGKTFTFKLRNDLKWSDGQPLTIDDFTYAWQNVQNEDYVYVGIDDVERIESFATPDPTTIVVTLKETLARDVAIGVANTIGPVPRHVWQGKSWSDPSANPEILRPNVTCGPYKIKEWNAPESATFDRNPHWFKGQPNFEQIVLRPGQQPTVAYELLKSNQALWAREIPPSQYTEAKQNPNLNLYEWNPANGLYRVLDFNLQRDFFKDKRVREAIARTINRDDIIQVAENNLGQPQYSFLNPTNTKWYNPNVEKYDFDVNKSKQLLQDAGYRLEGGRLLGQDGQQIRLQVLYPVTSNPRARIATYLQQQLRQLGIELEVKGLDANAYFEEAKRKNFDLSLNSWGGGSIDPDLGPKAQLISQGTQNYTSYDNPRVDELFTQGAAELDEAKRKAIYNEIQKIIADDLPSFYLYSLESFSPMSKRVLGVQPTKLDDLDANDAIARWSLSPQ